MEDLVLVVEREIELEERWFGPELLPELRELALNEHRSAKKRLRLVCPS